MSKTSRTKKTYYSLGSFLSYLNAYKPRMAFIATGFILSNIALAIMPLFIGKLIGALASNPVQGHQAVIYVWILIGASSTHSFFWHGTELFYMKLIFPLSHQ